MQVNCGFSGFVFLLLFIFKMTDVIAWSWWWITAPLWAPFVFCAFVVGFIFVGTMAIDAYKRSQR